VLDEILARFDGSFLSLWGPFFLLLICGLGFPLPEDLALIAAGMLGSEYHHSLPLVASIMYIGILIGDGMIYFAGRIWGNRLLNSKLGQMFLHPERLPRVRDMFHRYGPGVVFVGRFLPGLRAPIFFTAGTLHFSQPRFFLLDGFAALISAPLFVWLGHAAWENYGDDLHQLQSAVGTTKGILLGVALVFALAMFLFIRLRSKNPTPSSNEPSSST
jgi:membrane protein DedA with SNARE-associated domain